MQIIKLKHPYSKKEIINEDIVLILGFFDGVHLAHQQVIKKGVEIARDRGLKTALMTFNRNPSLVYRKLSQRNYTNLTQPEQKAKIIEKLGVDILYEVFFNSEFGNLAPEEFVDQYIVDWHAKVVVAGYDYTYGKPNIASMEHLPQHAKGRFEVVKVGEEKEEGTTISSTIIRQYVRDGEIAKANKMLGYNYETLGFVIHGDARGRLLGFPTANVYSGPYTLIPHPGIYAVWFNVKGKRYMGMASIGYNITFKTDQELSIEVNIFDFDEEIYGDDIKIEWVSYLRGEKRFNSADELISQLQEDEVKSREILSKEANKHFL